MPETNDTAPGDKDTGVYVTDNFGNRHEVKSDFGKEFLTDAIGLDDNGNIIPGSQASFSDMQTVIQGLYTNDSRLEPQEAADLELFSQMAAFNESGHGDDQYADGTIYDTNLYTTPEIERIGRVAFDMARARNGKVTSVEKANVMMSGVLWREVMVNLHKKEGAGIDINHMYADNCAMQLVRDPNQFDVIVTDNLFGDILSDCAAMLTGSLGMLPSASLGSVDKNTGKRYAMYEPVHGSAPDIAGKGLANPLAELLSLSMLLRYSFDMKEEADLIDKAVSKALDVGPRTPDIMAKGREKVGTTGMMDLVIHKLEELTN